MNKSVVYLVRDCSVLATHYHRRRNYDEGFSFTVNNKPKWWEWPNFGKLKDNNYPVGARCLTLWDNQ